MKTRTPTGAPAPHRLRPGDGQLRRPAGDAPPAPMRRWQPSTGST